MNEKTPQTAANHTRFDPPFHFFLLPIAAAELVHQIVNTLRAPGFQTAWSLVLAMAAVVAVFMLRVYSLKVQDRVIRLEEQLRLARTLPEPLRGKIADLTVDQLVGLRFAPDPELASLVEQTLANNWNRKAIKQAVKNWRPDYFRV